MATVTKKTSPPPPPPRPGSSSPLGFIVRGADAIYRFLASLKLAVFSLGTLAAVLAYATFFESWYGAGAVQEWIYRSKGFAILLAFLGANILCAALIRFPWKRRQTGFVITHAGLLVLLAGSLRSVYTADEGQVGHARRRRQGSARADGLPGDPRPAARPQDARADPASSRSRSGRATSPGDRASPVREGSSARWRTRRPSAPSTRRPTRARS